MFEFNDVKFKDIIDIPKLFISEGKVTTFMGPSGSGKTTILKMLNKIITPSEGSILFYGQCLDEIDPILHRRQVTMLTQVPTMFEGDTRNNLIAGLKFQNREIPDDTVLEEMLIKVKLKKELNTPVNVLSGGEKQRLALARVLLLDSDVYLLDEPSSALDEVTAESIIEMITGYVKNMNKTLVMVTHSKAIAGRFSDEVIEVSTGRCCWRSV